MLKRSHFILPNFHDCIAVCVCNVTQTEMYMYSIALYCITWHTVTWHLSYITWHMHPITWRMPHVTWHIQTQDITPRWWYSSCSVGTWPLVLFVSCIRCQRCGLHCRNGPRTRGTITAYTVRVSACDTNTCAYPIGGHLCTCTYTIGGHLCMSTCRGHLCSVYIYYRRSLVVWDTLLYVFMIFISHLLLQHN